MRKAIPEPKVEALGAAKQPPRAILEARAAVALARRETAEARAAAEQAQLEAASARAAAEQARQTAFEAVAALEAMRCSSSWRVTKPLRAAGYLFKGHWGRALLEIGVPLRQVEHLAGSVRPRRMPAAMILPPKDDPRQPTAQIPELSGRAQRIYLKLKAAPCTVQRLDKRVTETGGTQTADISLSAGTPPAGSDRARPRLAFVSPLPPDETGIAAYSDELLPELEKYYTIALITGKASISDGRYKERYEVHTMQWLRENAQKLDRVLYHIGNSPFHKEMLELLEEVPGVVVLHDFFLGHLMANSEVAQFAPSRWLQTLYQSHGYSAVYDFYLTADSQEILFRYPVNYPVLQNASGVIVHSEHSRELARSWYGESSADDWQVIPHLRRIDWSTDKAQARSLLDLDSEDFVVCSFGDVGPAKLNHRLLAAWLASALSRDKRCLLIFVGQTFNGEYEAGLRETLALHGYETRVFFTGRTDGKTYQHYLMAADIGVQLRTLSRGETSGTVLDCLGHGLPTIVNANGAMAELPADTVWMLPDAFYDEQLTRALEALWTDKDRLARLGNRGRAMVFTRHDPGECGRRYAAAVELFHAREKENECSIAQHLAPLVAQNLTDAACRRHANRLAALFAGGPPARRIFLDITATLSADLRTGIERVARALTIALLKSPPAGYRIEPVYLANDGGEWHYRHAIQHTLGLLNQPAIGWRDDLMIPYKGDVLIGLDLCGEPLIKSASSGLFDRLRSWGVATYFMVYDLLPIHHPEYFPAGSAANHAKWLNVVARLDGAICISKSVAGDLRRWLETTEQPGHRLKIGWSHLGADLENSAPSLGLPADAAGVLRQLEARTTFLAVGTIEPRKGYLQIIEAFSNLWDEGYDINLVIVGHEGWKDLPIASRRTIPAIVDRLNGHQERGRRLFWLEGISDEYLERVYSAATCMILASENEGFGLPIIEAARHDLPIIARDIDVFRELALNYASYFSGTAPEALADAVIAWLAQYEAGEHPRSGAMPWLTWEQSARRLMQIVLGNDFQNVSAAAEVELGEAIRIMQTGEVAGF